VKITLFLKSFGVRVAKDISKEFTEPHNDEKTWPEAITKERPMLRHNMHSRKH